MQKKTKIVLISVFCLAVMASVIVWAASQPTIEQDLIIQDYNKTTELSLLKYCEENIVCLIYKPESNNQTMAMSCFQGNPLVVKYCGG